MLCFAHKDTKNTFKLKTFRLYFDKMSLSIYRFVLFLLSECFHQPVCSYACISLALIQ